MYLGYQNQKRWLVVFVWYNFNVWNTVTHETENYKFITISTTPIFTFLENKRQFVATEQFFFNLLLYLQINQTCHLQRTPLHSRYTAPNVLEFWNVCWNVFCGKTRKFRIEFSSICYTVWNRRTFSDDFQFGKRKSPQGQIWRVGLLGHSSRLMLRRKFTDNDWRVSRRGTNFAATRRTFRFSVKVRWHEILQTPTSAATSRTVRSRFWPITARTFWMWSSSIDKEGRPDLESSSMDVLPDLKRWYHSWHCLRLKQSSP